MWHGGLKVHHGCSWGVGHSCSEVSVPSLETSTHCRYSQKNPIHTHTHTHILYMYIVFIYINRLLKSFSLGFLMGKY